MHSSSLVGSWERMTGHQSHPPMAKIFDVIRSGRGFKYARALERSKELIHLRNPLNMNPIS
jgi:hypothetical protein